MAPCLGEVWASRDLAHFAKPTLSPCSVSMGAEARGVLWCARTPIRQIQLSQDISSSAFLAHDVPLPLRRSLRRARRLVLRPGGRDLQDALRRAGGFDGPSRCTRYRMRMRQRFKVPQTIRAPTPKLRDSCAHAHLITHQLYHPLHPILFSLRLDTTSLSTFPPIQVPPR